MTFWIFWHRINDKSFQQQKFMVCNWVLDELIHSGQWFNRHLFHSRRRSAVLISSKQRGHYNSRIVGIVSAKHRVGSYAHCSLAGSFHVELLFGSNRQVSIRVLNRVVTGPGLAGMSQICVVSRVPASPAPGRRIFRISVGKTNRKNNKFGFNPRWLKRVKMRQVSK